MSGVMGGMHGWRDSKYLSFVAQNNPWYHLPNEFTNDENCFDDSCIFTKYNFLNF